MDLTLRTVGIHLGIGACSYIGVLEIEILLELCKIGGVGEILFGKVGIVDIALRTVTSTISISTAAVVSSTRKGVGFVPEKSGNL